MKIKVLYFAQLADLAGKAEETVELDDPSAAALYEKIKSSYSFPHKFEQLQVAINHELSAHEKPIEDGDEVAFLPPMTGG